MKQWICTFQEKKDILLPLHIECFSYFELLLCSCCVCSAYVGGPHSTPLLEDEGSEDIDPYHASHFDFNMVFGCQYSLTGLFKSQLADGIMVRFFCNGVASAFFVQNFFRCEAQD